MREDKVGVVCEVVSGTEECNFLILSDDERVSVWAKWWEGEGDPGVVGVVKSS